LPKLIPVTSFFRKWYAIVSKEKRKVLEKIVRSDKRIKSIRIIALINQKVRVGKTT